MRMTDGVDLGGTKIAYQLIDIRTLEAEALIANALKGPERGRVLAQMVLLWGAPANGTAHDGVDDYGRND